MRPNTPSLVVRSKRPPGAAEPSHAGAPERFPSAMPASSLSWIAVGGWVALVCSQALAAGARSTHWAQA